MLQFRPRSFPVLVVVLLGVARLATLAQDGKNDVPQHAAVAPTPLDAAREEAATERKRADAAQQLAEQQRDRAEWLEYAVRLGQVQQDWADERDSGSSMRALLDDCSWNLRGWEHRYWYTLLHHRGQRTLARQVQAFRFLAISPDGRRIASHNRFPNRVQVWSPESDAPLFDCPTNKPPLGIAFSPDGKTLMSLGGQGLLQTWDAETGAEIPLTPPATDPLPRGTPSKPTLSPDGKQFAVVNSIPPEKPTTPHPWNATEIAVWNRETGQLITTYKGTKTLQCYAYHPQGNRIVSVDINGLVKVWDTADGRERLSFQAHKGLWLYGVRAIAYSPDGQLLATGTSNGQLRLWNAEDGRERLVLSGHTGHIWSLSFSPDGRRLVSASNDQTGRVWDVATGESLRTLRGQRGEMAFHPDGRRVVNASGDDIKLWDVEEAHVDRRLAAHTGIVTRLSASDDGRLLATTGTDKAIKLWDVRSPEQLELRATFECEHFVHQIALSGDGRWLGALVHGEERKAFVPGPQTLVLKLWEVATQQPLKIARESAAKIGSIAFSPDDELLAISEDQQTTLWEPRTGQAIHTIRAWLGWPKFSNDSRWLVNSTGSSVHVWSRADWREVRRITPKRNYTLVSFAISPDGSRLVTSLEDQSLTAWDATTGNELHPLRGHSGPVTNLTFSPDGERLIGNTAQDWHVWDARHGQHLLTFREPPPSSPEPDRSNPPAVFLANGQTLVTRMADGHIRLRPGSHRPPVRSLVGHTDTVHHAAYNRDGSRLATASADHTVKIWDLRRGQVQRTLVGHNARVNNVCFSLDGSLLASCSHDNTVKLWDVETGRERPVLADYSGRIQAMALRPDGQRLASGCDDKMIRIWNPTSGESIATWPSDKLIRCMAYSPDGRVIASSGDEFITLRDEATGAITQKLKGDGTKMHRFEFSPDGRLIACIEDHEQPRRVTARELKLWNAATGEQLPSPVKTAFVVAFSPDSRRLAIVSKTSLSLWDIATSRELVTFRGYSTGVTSLAFHPDGHELTCVGAGPRHGTENEFAGPGEIRVWNIPPIDPNKTVEVWSE